MSLYHSTFRWFGAPSCKTTPVVQLTTVSTILTIACRTLYYRCSASQHTIKRWGFRSYFTIKVQRTLIGEQTPVYLPLPQCFMTARHQLAFIHFQSNISINFAVPRAFGLTHSLTSFGLSIGSWGLAMCVAVKSWHFISSFYYLFS